MIFLTIFLSFFTWGQNCQFNESQNSFKVQCGHSSAQWIESKVNESIFSVKLSRDLKLNLVFKRRLNDEYSLSHFSVDKGLRFNSWINDQDLYYLKQLNKVTTDIDFASEEMRLFKSSIEYLTALPIYENLEELAKASRKKNIYAGYTMICKYIGRWKRGYYRVEGKKYSRSVRVGRKRTGCYGRCGRGCNDSSAWQYTQECLNHDVCASDMNSNLGPCSDEFWAASDGYLFAPNCE